MIPSVMLTFLPNLVTPGLFLAGALAMLVPILIHLLNRRRFKIVEWAAMDFLKQAEKLNKRRVQLEDLLLLLLRCLAVLLLGFLLARPFLKSGFVGNLLSDARAERVFILDDSPSMAARGADGTSMDVAVRKLSVYLTTLAADGSGDAATLYLTSRPRKPLFAGVPLKSGNLTEMLETLDGLEASDRPADYSEVMGQIRRRMQEKSSNLNRLLFVISDLRQKDWGALADQTEDTTLANLKTLSDDLSGCFLLDLGSSETANLELVSVEAQDKTLVGGVPTRFDVTVRNRGNQAAEDVKVVFTPENSLPVEDRIPRIPPGGVASVPFTFAFAKEAAEEAGILGRPAGIRVAIKPNSEAEDVLDRDNERLFPGRVLKGVSVVVVDGNADASRDRRESFFLEKALAPQGNMPSGMDVKVVGVEEFDDINLADVQYLVLCNAYRVTNRPERKEERLAELRAWLERGGGMFVALGDEVDEDYYNAELCREGKGILPVKLKQMVGDETGETWANYRLLTANHPALKVFEGEQNPLLADVKVFRWWQCETPALDAAELAGDDPDATNQLDQAVNVLARYTSEDGDPALVEAAIGQGRVLVSTTSLDLDWNNWPKEFSYLIAQQEFARHLARDDSAEGMLTVGEPLRQSIDLSRYKIDMQLSAPGDNGEQKTVSVQARKPSGANAVDGNAPIWIAEFDDVERRGFYALEVVPTRGGDPETVLFAANVQAGEGDLERVDTEGLKAQLAEGNIQYTKAFPASGQEIASARHEIWKTILLLLVVLLCGEQFFAWWLGNRRTVT